MNHRQKVGRWLQYNFINFSTEMWELGDGRTQCTGGELSPSITRLTVVCMKDGLSSSFYVGSALRLREIICLLSDIDTLLFRLQYPTRLSPPMDWRCIGS